MCVKEIGGGEWASLYEWQGGGHVVQSSHLSHKFFSFSLFDTYSGTKRALGCFYATACFAEGEIWNTPRYLLAVACMFMLFTCAHSVWTHFKLTNVRASLSPWHTVEVWLIKDEGLFWGARLILSLWQQERKRQNERQGKMKGSRQGLLWSPQDTHCEWAVHPETDGRIEDRKKENSHILCCLMPVVCLCNYSPLSLACSRSFTAPFPHHSFFTSLSLPSSCWSVPTTMKPPPH